MNQNATTVINHAASVTAGGGLMSAITQNASAITVMVVVITGIASIWINRRNAKTNERNAAANEKRNEINERDIKLKIIEDLKKDGMHSEASVLISMMTDLRQQER